MGKKLTKSTIKQMFMDRGFHPLEVTVQRWAEDEYEFGYARTTVQLENGFAYSVQTIKSMNNKLTNGGEFYIKPKSSLGNDYYFGVD